MRKLLWKKAAITAMAGTMMMMTGCELQGAVNKNQTKIGRASCRERVSTFV